MVDEDLSVVAGFVPPILAPHFKATFIWEGLDVDAARNLGVVALADGRAFGFPLSGDDEPWEIEVSTPILAGDVPISASIGYGLLFDDDLVVQTSDTNVPYGSASAASRPPSPHPHSNTLAAYGPDRTLRWTWTGEHLLNGLVVSADGRTGVAGTRARNRDQREDLFGALLFRLDGVGTGAERLEAVCPTEGPVFFRSATTSDGRVAVAEHPFLRDDGSHGGRYRVTVLR